MLSFSELKSGRNAQVLRQQNKFTGNFNITFTIFFALGYIAHLEKKNLKELNFVIGDLHRTEQFCEKCNGWKWKTRV
jgi:hypothetical protein